jgi:hypothetical protein
MPTKHRRTLALALLFGTAVMPLAAAFADTLATAASDAP